MTTFFRVAWLVLRKDIAIEVRSWELVFTTVFFAVSCVLVFAVAFVVEGRAVSDVAAGILWVATAFSGTLALGRTFGQAIANDLQTPVYALSGFCAPEGSEVARLGRHLLFWTGALATVLLFFLVQINVQRLAQDWVQSLVLMLTVIVEFGLLAAWNSWLN